MPAVPEPESSTVGELAAFGQLWEAHRDRLLAMLERRIDPRLRARIDADAILDETYLEATRRWPAYQRGSVMKPYPWLYCIARDRLYAESRKQTAGKRHPERESPLIGDDCSAMLGGQFVDPGTGPLTAAQRADLADRVRSVLASLPDDVADVIVMRYFDQLSTREICDVVNDRDPNAVPITENAMNVRLFRALEKMEKAWKGRYGTPESSP